MRGFPRSRDSLVAVAAAWKKMPSNSSKLATALPLRDSFGFRLFLCRRRRQPLTLDGTASTSTPTAKERMLKKDNSCEYMKRFPLPRYSIVFLKGDQNNESTINLA